MNFVPDVIRPILKQPISVEFIEGEDCSVDPIYEFIEEEMMKVGSLSHGAVKWQEVEKNLIHLLSEKTKDIKLIDYFIDCCKRRGDVNAFLVALTSLTDFIDSYWQNCFPQKGNNAAVFRKRVLNKITKKLDLFIDSIAHFDVDLATLDDVLRVRGELDDALIKQDIASESSDALLIRVKRKFTSEKERLALSASTKEEAKAAANRHGAFAETDNKAAVTPEKEVKSKCLEVADIVQSNDGDALLALSIRRYVLWSSIQALPDAKDNKTLIMAPPKERVKEYFSSLSEPTHELWLRVENTISMAPFWLDGQWLSYSITLALGQSSLAQRIHYETQRFVDAYPDVFTLCFKDGSPFASDEAKEWLLNESNASSIGAANASSSSSVKDEIDSILAEQGLAEALLFIEDKIKKANANKDKYELRLIACELLKKSGAVDASVQQSNFIYHQVSEMQVSDWDPLFFKRLKKHTSFD
ncbi:type VI secretion system protein TssA [Marinomonas sp. THO17]|uniref:type VI secretion system protein TssA n=1 Tax=Marinomonas sp. THO17 TaxID=3149048 RepID=UPI00336BB780